MIKELIINGKSEDYMSGIFDKNDHAILFNPNYTNQIKKHTKNIKYDFNILIHPTRNTKLNNTFTDTNCFNIAIRNNSSTENGSLPLTPWILIHRAIHAIEATTKYQTHIMNNDSEFISGDIKILNKKIKNIPYGDFSYFILKNMMTMKSARDNKLRSIDTQTELLTQYVFSGENKFNRIENFKFSNYEEFKKELYYYSAYKDDLYIKQYNEFEKEILNSSFNDIIEELETLSNNYCKKFFEDTINGFYQF